MQQPHGFTNYAADRSPRNSAPPAPAMGYGPMASMTEEYREDESDDDPLQAIILAMLQRRAEGA